MSGDTDVQAGAVPFLFKKGVLHIVLITSSSGARWLIPKGHLESGMSLEEVALMEAAEEAGAIGTIEPGCRMQCPTEDGRTLQLFPLRVATLLPHWPERFVRRRVVLPVYRALLSPPEPGSALLQLAVGETLPLETPIGRRPHGRLGSLWCAAAPGDGGALPARSQLTLLESRADGWLVQVAIATGRPHQIRIHTAAAGAPLLGDPLYLPGGLARADALPGDGGYQLHAHRLSLSPPDGQRFSLEAPLPQVLQIALKSDYEG
jgi:8-oxo-dGTP pyrophosphatase MutT (NUDIX family)